MKKKFLAIVALVLAAGLCLSACGNNDDVATETLDFTGYPIAGENELTYWCTLNGNVSMSYAELADSEFAKALEKETGVKVKYLHPPQGQERDQLNILLTSKDLPDIIEYEWAYFPGGTENANQQGYIIELSSLIEESSPNLRKYLDENPDVDKQAKTDDGKYYVYPFVRGSEKSLVFNGPMVRKDWLDELNLPIPETLDDWYVMLKAFKEKKGATAPLSYNSALFVSYLNNGNFIGAYDIIRGFYVKDGKVVYGGVEPQYKEFLDMYAKWYAEGLIDKNISNVDGKALDANILNGRTGATIGYVGSGIGTWTKAAADIPGFELAAVPYPVMNRGDKPMFGQRDAWVSTSGNAAITSSCKNTELAARFLDYGYSEAGNKLFNYGIEGVSYEMVDGQPFYTDEILNNPDDLSIAAALAKYTRASYFGPFVVNKEYAEQSNVLPQQKEALEIWANTDAATNNLPQLALTPEESTEAANIMNNIDTYIDEYSLKVIMNMATTDDFDAYVEQVKQYDLDRVTEIYQAAYDRYLNR